MAIAPPETRKERWLKYGVNVGVMSVAAIVLAGLLTYLAQKQDWRIDTTIGGVAEPEPANGEDDQEFQGESDDRRVCIRG